ncbi:MAG: hypothetical protein L6R30_06475 [Thermoanaerobaculia bacterium]|nr:hypothetical protein [Thermoanaerobaculia bacterium]
MFLAAAAVLAIITQDATSLRAAPSQTAPANAVLWQGEVVEVRGGRLGYLQVYNYQRERAGYVLESQARQYPMDGLRPAGVLETVRFLRDLPGMEALGIGHAALFLKVAPPAEIDAEVFDALGTMSDRLARRASARSGRPGDALAGHLEVARSYGVRIESVEADGRAVLCYDGEAFRQVLSLARGPALTLSASGAGPAGSGRNPEFQARAALGLTRLECQTGTETQRRAALAEAAAILDGVPLDSLPPLIRYRLQLRRASVLAGLAFGFGRAGEAERAREASARAVEDLARVPRGEMAESDADLVAEAFVRAGATRPASDTTASVSSKLAWRLIPRAVGETCLAVTRMAKGGEEELVHCTYAVVWPGSVHVSPGGQVITAALQPVAEWRELLVARLQDGEWRAEVVSPGTELGLGYLEWAGFSPDGRDLLVAREVKAGGRVRRSFELLDVETLAVKRKADRPQDLTPFQKWQAPAWRQATLALR